MAKILAFRQVELQRERSGFAARDASPGEVILFPGVRYERWGDAAATDEQARAARKQSGGRQRDILELAE